MLQIITGIGISKLKCGKQSTIYNMSIVIEKKSFRCEWKQRLLVLDTVVNLWIKLLVDFFIILIVD